MATSTINNPNIYTKVWTVDLDSVSSANGAYSHSTTVPKMTTDYKPILFECDDPSIFKDTVNVSTGQNTVTLSCNNAIGSTTGVKASFVLQGDADTLSSAEYQALGSRIGNLNNLNTSDKSSVVGAINALNTKLGELTLLDSGSSATERAVNVDLSPYRMIAVYLRTAYMDGGSTYRGLWGYLNIDEALSLKEYILLSGDGETLTLKVTSSGFTVNASWPYRVYGMI